MAGLSFLLAKKHYCSVNLIGDKIGVNLLKHLDWSSVSDELEDLPDGYKDVWSLSKLKAYYIIAQKKESFFHIDFDFFLIKKLSPNIERSPVVFQHRETGLDRFLNYNTDIFHRDIKFLPLRKGASFSGSEVKPVREAYNCGIVGGTDMLFFNLYSSLAIECVLSEENKQFWQNDSLMPITKATLAEQYYPSLIAKHNRPYAYVKFLESSWGCRDIDLSREYIHLLGEQSKHKINELEVAVFESNEFKDIAEKLRDYQKEL